MTFKEHEPQRCTIGKCKNEATRWYQDMNYPLETRYVCIEGGLEGMSVAEHAEHERIADGEVSGLVANSQGWQVELAAYSCNDECVQCNDVSMFAS